MCEKSFKKVSRFHSSDLRTPKRFPLVFLPVLSQQKFSSGSCSVFQVCAELQLGIYKKHTHSGWGVGGGGCRWNHSSVMVERGVS